MGWQDGTECWRESPHGQDDTDTSLGKLLSLFDNCGLRAQTGSGGYTNVSSRVGVLYLAWSVVTVLDFRIWAG